MRGWLSEKWGVVLLIALISGLAVWIGIKARPRQTEFLESGLQLVIVSKTNPKAPMHYLNTVMAHAQEFHTACRPKDHPFSAKEWKVIPLEVAEVSGYEPCEDCQAAMWDFMDFVHDCKKK